MSMPARVSLDNPSIAFILFTTMVKEAFLIPLGWLFHAFVVVAEEPSTKGWFGSLLEDRDGEMTRVAQALLGERGGDSLFYLPTRDQPQTPKKWNFAYEEVNFKSADGTPLHGWFLPARTGNPKATVVFSHGNAGSIGHHLGFVMWLVEAGYQIFMYDYRGFGKSGGAVNRRGMIEDAQAAFREVVKRPCVDAGTLFSYGHSMGGAKSIAALAEVKPDGLRGVIVDGCFSSYREMARFFAGDLGANLSSDEWSPGAHVAQIAPVPILIVHGEKDEVVPFSQGEALHEAAAEPKTFYKVANGRHGDALRVDHDAHRRKMLDWMEKNLRGSSS